jgi:hypothetical protein
MMLLLLLLLVVAAAGTVAGAARGAFAFITMWPATMPSYTARLTIRGGTADNASGGVVG